MTENNNKTKRVRISNDSLNSYGSRVLTEGMNIEQYERNPVLLYMHRRGDVIGYVKDIRKENDEVTGELFFDEASELSAKCKKQWEVGSLRMVSAGLDVIEMSDDPKFLLQGQKYSTITKSKLFEISLVDIGANDDAIVLRKDGQQITLGDGEINSLPLINNKQNKKEMELQTLALQLGLPATADEMTVNGKIAELNAKADELATLKKENEALKLSSITALVDNAITEQRLTAAQKEEFVQLGKDIGVERLGKVIAAMNPRVKITETLSHHGSAPFNGKTTYNKLSEVPAQELAELRANNKEEYAKLYKAEYGVECDL